MASSAAKGSNCFQVPNSFKVFVVVIGFSGFDIV